MNGDTSVPVIARTDGRPDWSAVPPLAVAVYSWGGDYRPDTTARLAFDGREGLWVRMMTAEAEPTAIYTSDYDPVYKDSCLECFICFQPDNPSAGYLNVEVNANGAALIGFGADRHGRKTLPSMGLLMPKIAVERQPKSWAVEYLLPLTLIEALYPGVILDSGAEIRGNFYKCGDDTSAPHYGSWRPIDNPTPDFHRPAFFGKLILA